MWNQARDFRTPIRNEDSQRGTLRLPDVNQFLRKRSFIWQVVALIVNITMTALFCWKFFFSFIENSPIDPATISFGSENGMGLLACFSDVDGEWRRWIAFILIGFFVVVDLFNSLIYLKTLIESRLGSSCCNFLSYPKLCSPTYSLFVAFQSLWLQHVSLNCTNSNTLGSVFNFTSVSAGIQSMTIIICGVSSLWLRIAESGLCCCIDRSSKEGLKIGLKWINALLQVGNFGVSLVVWILNVKDMTFDFSWTDWFIVISSPLWLGARIIEYILNIFAHKEKQEQEREQEEDSASQWNTSDIEMREIANQNQQRWEGGERNGGYYSDHGRRPYFEDYERIGNAG